MNKSLLALTAILVLSVGITPAFATHIEGEVTNTSSQTLNGAWVNSEAANNYAHTTQPSSGDYLVGPTSGTNTVSASQYYFERDTQTGVAWYANNIDFSLSTQSVENLEYVIAVDGVSTSTMRGHINNAEDYFQIEHSINFIEDSSTTWSINGNLDCGDALDELESDVSWSSISANSDILIGFVDEQLTAVINGNTVDVNACTRGPFSSTASPVIVIGDSSSDYPRSIMHELTHDYDMDHETASCTSQIPNIMAVDCTSQYVKNWTPSQDTNMENRRSWY